MYAYKVAHEVLDFLVRELEYKNTHILNFTESSNIGIVYQYKVIHRDIRYVDTEVLHYVNNIAISPYSPYYLKVQCDADLKSFNTKSWFYVRVFKEPD